ncbi:MAG: homocysteine S-methyltransferase [Gemmatimonadetes bacterium]|nr:homocysteine S-methyltransferase [Gemmatimonadota bacterium]
MLDGGLASELESAGHDLNDPLWSAKVLLEDPAAVEAVHTTFLDAGADCVTTATYQATFQGLAERGIGESAAEGIFRGAVDLAVRTRDRFWASRENRAVRVRPLVAASIGPYGAFLADGAEYRGDYSIGTAALADFHRSRLRLLADTAADVLACETIPSFGEARVLAALVKETGSTPAWFTFTCRDEGHISDGTPIGEVAAWAQESAGVFAVGVNCTSAAYVPRLVRALAAGTRKPVIAYPNGGGEWDAVTKTWGRTDEVADWGRACREWIASGAVAVGGCCRVGPDRIRHMRKALTETREGT